jgi:uncharacterized protein (DUF1778 family)
MPTNPKTNLTTIAVYANVTQKEMLEMAAARDNRSLSNFLLTLGMRRADELGVTYQNPSGK